MNMTKLIRKYILYTLIGSLIVAAAVAVLSVLIGSFNNTSVLVIWTLVSLIGHSLLYIALIDRNENKVGKYYLFLNTVLILLVVSFVTSLLGIWTTINGELVSKLYHCYTVVAISALQINFLSLMLKQTKLINKLVWANFGFLLAVLAFYMPVVFLDNPSQLLSDIYFRILASLAIIDGTLTVMTLIFYKMYLQKNPKAVNQLALTNGGKPLGALKWFLIIFILIQVLPFMIFSIAGLFSSNY